VKNAPPGRAELAGARLHACHRREAAVYCGARRFGGVGRGARGTGRRSGGEGRANIMGFLVPVFGIIWLVCWIMVLIKIFQDKEKNGVLHGVIGILCSLWAFIWGWMNVSRFGNKNIMIIWTVATIGYFVFGGMTIFAAFSGIGAPK
jgi:uncharacterized membrane protein YhaH (DUF805 family)